MTSTAEIFFQVTVLPIVILGILGNLLVCTLILRTRKMRTPFNCLLLNLAVSDLLCVSLGMFMYIGYLNNFLQRNTFEFKAEELEEIIFKTVVATAGVSTKSSVFTLTAISMERYYAIVRPLKHRAAVMSKRNFRLGFLFLWFLTFITELPTFLFLAQMPNKFPDKCEGECLAILFQHSGADDTWKHVVLASLIFTYALPMLVILRTSLAVVKHLWWRRSQNSIRGANTSLLRHRKRITRVILSVLVAFNIFWLPWAVLQGAALSGVQMKIHNDAIIVSLVLVLSYAAINPFLYSFQSQQFRKRVQKLLCRN